MSALSVSSRYSALQLYDEAEHLDPDDDYRTPPLGVSSVLGVLRYPGGGPELGRLVLTTYLRRPEVPAVPHDGRWVAIELI